MGAYPTASVGAVAVALEMQTAADIPDRAVTVACVVAEVAEFVVVAVVAPAGSEESPEALVCSLHFRLDSIAWDSSKA